MATIQESAALRVVASVVRAQAAELPTSSVIAQELGGFATRLAEMAGPRPPDREVEERERHGQAMREREVTIREASEAWRRVRRDERERLVSKVLGEGRLLIRELTERINAALGYPESTDEDGYRSARAVYESEIRNLVVRLVRDGQLEREPEPFEGKIRYRYSRKRGLDGPIADLERAYRDDGEAVS